MGLARLRNAALGTPSLPERVGELAVLDHPVGAAEALARLSYGWDIAYLGPAG